MKYDISVFFREFARLTNFAKLKLSHISKKQISQIMSPAK